MANDEEPVRMESTSAEIPSGQSHDLVYDNRLKVKIVDRFGMPQAGVEYVLQIGDQERRGVTDSEGWLREADVRASDVVIRLSDGRILMLPQNQEQVAAMSRDAQSESETTPAEAAEDEVEEYTIPRARPDLFSEDEILEEYSDLLDADYEDEDDDDEDDGLED